MAKKSRRKGTRPARTGSVPADKDVLASIKAASDEYPVLSTRFLQKGWGFEEMTDETRLSFLQKWHKRSEISWKDLTSHQRHGLGSEYIPSQQIKPQVPRQFQEIEKFRVFRHHANLPFAGWKDRGIFYVLWIESRYNDLYDHG